MKEGGEYAQAGGQRLGIYLIDGMAKCRRPSAGGQVGTYVDTLVKYQK